MTKDFDYVLDLGKLSDDTNKMGDIVDECTAGRTPPLTPADFRVALSAKSFTSKKADEEMVAGLYESTFMSQFGQAKQLNYSSLSWGDAEAATFAKVIASGALASLRKLSLRRNAIGDVGLQSLAHAITPVSEGGSGALPQLENVYLFENPGNAELVESALRERKGSK